jgi:hypothetical protein
VNVFEWHFPHLDLIFQSSVRLMRARSKSEWFRALQTGHTQESLQTEKVDLAAMT